MYAKPENGGIGLFDLQNFIIALQSTWAKRAFQCCNDNWKFDLISTYENCPHKVGFFNNSLCKTLNNIAKSFQTFAEDFAIVESYYLHSPILNNIFNGLRSKKLQRFVNRSNRVTSTKWASFFAFQSKQRKKINDFHIGRPHCQTS